MPYASNTELPKGVKNHLPEHAQDIYRAAFNHAWVQHKSPDKRLGSDSRETVAHKVAWGAVEKNIIKMRKVNGLRVNSIYNVFLIICN
jgi:cation transport regulator